MNSTFAPVSFDSTPATARLLDTGNWWVNAGRAVMNALKASSEARARRHMIDYAMHCEALQPELAKELRAASRQFPVA